MLFNRTFHPDEANQAFTAGRLLETGSYTYQPQDHHGPTLYYAAAALQKAAGHGDTASLDGTLLRCTPLVFAAMGLVFGIFALKRLMRSFIPGAVFALLLGTAPFFAFFATDFIQEMLLACFLLMMYWAGSGYLLPGTKWKTGTWALFFGTAAGLAFATKETCLISFAAAAIAATPFLAKCLTLERIRAHARDGVLAILGFLVVSFIFYSDFGRDFHGVYNAFIAAPLAYLGRAAGDATASTGANWHVHPWWWYASLLFGGKSIYSLASIALAALAAVCVLARGSGRATRFAFLYALALFAIHSILPYKTPWCMLPVVSALALAATLGVADALNRNRRHFAVVALFAAMACGAQLTACVRMGRNPDATDIPCNYAAASPEVKGLAAIVDAAMKSPAAEPFIAVALPPEDTWPFPWYNRPWEPNTGYWTSFEDLAAVQKTGIKPSVVIVPMEMGHLVQPIFPHLKHTKRFYMRPRIPERNVRGVRVRVFW